MQPRAVRVPLLETIVRFNGREASLVNISRSGALLRMSDPVEVGSEARLTLSQRSTTIEIDGKVVRARGGESALLEPGERHVGVSFGSPTPHEVTAL
ncbi:MAG: PilZ domain-containing protein, partial [Vicinamibacterales bacterium]